MTANGGVPRHVALVMDGNGRWAQARGLPRREGHRRAEAALLDVLEGAVELGIHNLTAFAFSTENWRRSPDEVRFLLDYSRQVIRRQTPHMNELGVRVQWLGRRPRMWHSVIKELEIAEDETRANERLVFSLCFNYGGRAEITDAARAFAADVEAGRHSSKRLSEATFARYLYDPKLPDVDLFIRTSGEMRLSNFLLWQSAYAELVFTPITFPDFGRDDLLAACGEYSRRIRRFGGH